jgi:hypothetical protein
LELEHEHEHEHEHHRDSMPKPAHLKPAQQRPATMETTGMNCHGEGEVDSDGDGKVHERGNHPTTPLPLPLWIGSFLFTVTFSHRRPAPIAKNGGIED